MSSISLTRIGLGEYKAKISIKDHEISDVEKKALAKINSKNTLKGFRKGKAPEHLILSRFSHEIQKKSALMIFESVFDKINDQLDSGIHNVISISPIAENSMEVTFDCIPHLKLCKFKELNLYDDEIDVSDNLVRSILEKHQLEIALDHRKEKKAPFKYMKGDLIMMNVDILLDDVPITKAGNNHPFILEDKAEDKILLNYIIKNQPPLNTEFQLKETLEKEKKTMTRIISITAVFELEYPPIDDNFSKLLGDEFENLSALKESIRAKIYEASEEILIRTQINHAIKTIAEKSKCIVSKHFSNKFFDDYLKKVHPEGQPSEEEIKTHRMTYEESMRYFLIKEKVLALAFEYVGYENKTEFDDSFKDKTLLAFLKDKVVFKKGFKKPVEEIIKERFQKIEL